MMSMIQNLKRLSRRDALRLLGAGGLASLAAAAHGPSRGAAAVESAPLPKVVLEWFGAWSSDDPPRNLAALYAADGSYEDVPAGTSVLGLEIEGYLRGALAGLTDVNRYPRGSFAVDGLAVAEQLFWATNKAFVPGARVGAQFQIYAVTIFEFGGQTLHRSTDYYDFASILKQLGALPAVPADGAVSTPATSPETCGRQKGFQGPVVAFAPGRGIEAALGPDKTSRPIRPQTVS